MSDRDKKKRGIMWYLKTPFILIPIFLNVILLVGFPYFNTFNANPPLGRLYPVLMLAFVWPWVMYFVIGAIIDYLARQSARKRDEAEDRDFV